MTRRPKRIDLYRLLAVFLLASTLAACGQIQPLWESLGGGGAEETPPQTNEAQPESAPLPAANTPQTEVNFIVQIPEDTPNEDTIAINLLDEVSGLALNALTYPMEAVDDTHLQIKLQLPIGAVVKYRYSRHGEISTVQEHTSDGRPVRYRLLHVEGPAVVQDVVARWTDTGQPGGELGRINGQALDAITGQPVVNMLVAAGGMQTLSASDGSFLLEGLPPGVHNLVAYALDGAYQTFQQGARVAANATTPAELRLKAAKFVNLTFEVSVPKETIPAVPIRMAGNLYQLGNTFADLSGGISVLADRMPVLALKPEGGYTLNLRLPAGADLRYTYTLGDGFWNTELTANGSPRIRQLIVPSQDAVIQDAIESWRVSDAAAVTFDVTTPPETPPNDVISIQFDPVYGWTEPIPMWRLGPNRWAYILNGPVQIISNIRYRYCRNDQCEAAGERRIDAEAASTNGGGVNQDGRPVQPSSKPQTIKDNISGWAWLNPNEETIQPFPDNAGEAIPRGGGFVAGIELQAGYHPSWGAYAGQTLEDVQAVGANWVVLSPTWSFTRADPPVLEPLTQQDALWSEVSAWATRSLARGLKVAILPMAQFPHTGEGELRPEEAWWQAAPQNYPWWVAWFERYRNFALHHADLAARSGAQALILGGDWLAPAIPNSSGIGGTGETGLPADAEKRWRNLIQEVRLRYKGTLGWALSAQQAIEQPPAFLDAVDLVYVQFSAPLSEDPNAPVEALAAEAGGWLDRLQALQAQLGKAMVIAAAYPAVDGAASACLHANPGDAACIEVDALAHAETWELPGLQLDLGEQAKIYAALLSAVNQRPWLAGFVSAGYYPPARLEGKSASVHGKPAEDVLRYWYPRWLGNNP